MFDNEIVAMVLNVSSFQSAEAESLRPKNLPEGDEACMNRKVALAGQRSFSLCFSDQPADSTDTPAQAYSSTLHTAPSSLAPMSDRLTRKAHADTHVWQCDNSEPSSQRGHLRIAAQSRNHADVGRPQRRLTCEKMSSPASKLAGLPTVRVILPRSFASAQLLNAVKSRGR